MNSFMHELIKLVNFGKFGLMKSGEFFVKHDTMAPSINDTTNQIMSVEKIESGGCGKNRLRLPFSVCTPALSQ